MPLHPIIRPVDIVEATTFKVRLADFIESIHPLPGIDDACSRDVFIGQLVESGRRRRYAVRLGTRRASSRVLDASSGAFNPLMGAVRMRDFGDFDNACWLVFLSVHFGRPKITGWSLVSEFYSKLGQGGVWDWASVQSDVNKVRTWLDDNQVDLKLRGGKFGNHRKYESLNGSSAGGTGEVIETYLEWVDGSHAKRLGDLMGGSSNPREAFGRIYPSLGEVVRFGRTARFDYLTMIGKLGIVDIEPDKAYLANASGPRVGAQLMLEGTTSSTSSSAVLEIGLSRLASHLEITFDVLEDALCNWQKSPTKFIAFRG